MADITMNVGTNIDRRDLEALKKNLKNLAKGDKLTIRMEAADAHEADLITDELARQGFDYQPRGGHGTEFYFVAKKIKE